MLTDADLERAEGELNAAQQKYSSAVERGRASLFRGDGHPVYGPQEQQEREQALRAEAATPRDAVVQRHVERGDAAVAEAERQLAVLAGADPLAALTGEDAQRAAVRRSFIQEDAALPAHQLASRIAAVVAAGDRVEGLLFARYLHGRYESAPAGERQALATLLEQLAPLTSDPQAAEKRRAAEALMQRGRKLRQLAWQSTREERVQELVSAMRASGAYSF